MKNGRDPFDRPSDEEFQQWIAEGEKRRVERKRNRIVDVITTCIVIAAALFVAWFVFD